jgi:hypothetical protein
MLASDRAATVDSDEVAVLVGHRRRLLDGIAALHSATGTASKGDGPTAPSGEEAASQVRSGAPPTSTAERRQLTVMFCYLVGSTALSARLDPEDMREIVGAYHRNCAEQITKAGGFVAKYMGDGVLAYFGYPQAHEDDAERAVRAGLDRGRARRRTNVVDVIPQFAARLVVRRHAQKSLRQWDFLQCCHELVVSPLPSTSLPMVVLAVLPTRIIGIDPAGRLASAIGPSYANRR